jgi:hypothetical protein
LSLHEEAAVAVAELQQEAFFSAFFSFFGGSLSKEIAETVAVLKAKTNVNARAEFKIFFIKV